MAGRNRRGNSAVLENEVDAPDAAQADATEVEDVSGTEVTPEPEVVDLTSFQAAVDAVDASDPNYDGVKEAYDALSRKGKFGATASIRTRTMQSLENDDTETATKLAKISRYFKSLTPTSTATPTDPTVELVNRIAALRLATDQLSTTELETRVTETISNPNEIVQALVAKLVATKAARKPRSGDGTRHDVGAHITQVFANVASGEWLDSKAIAAASSEEYSGPSTKSAVEAKLKGGKFSSDGISVEERDGKVGAVKA